MILNIFFHINQKSLITANFCLMSCISKPDLREQCVKILMNHRFLVTRNIEGSMNQTDVIPIPHFEPNLLIELSKAVKSIFMNEPVMLKINDPIVVVGDIHGHLFDLERIFVNFGNPPMQRYLFLGDLVDRGEFNTETVVLLLAMKYLYPQNIFFIRGNHEFFSTSASGGFADEVEQLYPFSRLFNYFMDTFSYMPISALLFDKILCVHGGPCPDLVCLSQLETIERPIIDFDNPLICGLLWSDPSFNNPNYSPSRRKKGWLFGHYVLNCFLKANNLKMLVRGHECVQNGYEKCFDDQLLTIFSASNYCGCTGNKSSVVMFRNADSCEPVVMEPIKYIKRSSTTYSEPIETTNKELNDLKISSSLKLSSIVIGQVVHPFKPLIRHLHSAHRLKNITRRRRRKTGTGSSLPVFHIDISSSP